MELWEAMERRHSVRAYEDRALEPEAKAELLSLIEQCNRESGLHMQLGFERAGGLRGLYGPLRENFPAFKTISPSSGRSPLSWRRPAATTGNSWCCGPSSWV